MEKEAIIKQTVALLQLLPNDKVEEVNDFVAYIYNKHESEILTKGIMSLTEKNNSFEFLMEDKVEYSLANCKEIFVK